MKYALISDIHANLPALQAVLEDIQAQHCTNSACLGDIVGNNAQPKECLDIIRGMRIPCVKGNYDEHCSDFNSLDNLNPKAAAMIKWTIQQLTTEDSVWLYELPYILTIAGFTIVHAMMSEPHRWEYVFDKLAAARSFAEQKTSVCFFGHTHIPMAFVRDSTFHGGTYSKFRIEAGKQYFVNVGSVGQPRDGIPKAAYTIYDLEEKTVELRRVAFENPPGDSGSAAVPSDPYSPKPNPLDTSQSKINQNRPDYK
ncbi:MAG: metallophosphoesterase family protein [Verrucomicrobiota bacterium]